MCEWFNSYALPLKIEEDKLNEYINLIKISFQNNDEILQNKVEQIESDYLEKIELLKIEYTDLNSIEKYKNKNSLEILQKELDIIKLFYLI